MGTLQYLATPCLGMFWKQLSPPGSTTSQAPLCPSRGSARTPPEGTLGHSASNKIGLK